MYHGVVSTQASCAREGAAPPNPRGWNAATGVTCQENPYGRLAMTALTRLASS